MHSPSLFAYLGPISIIRSTTRHCCKFFLKLISCVPKISFQNAFQERGVPKILFPKYYMRCKKLVPKFLFQFFFSIIHLMFSKHCFANLFQVLQSFEKIVIQKSQLQRRNSHLKKKVNVH